MKFWSDNVHYIFTKPNIQHRCSHFVYPSASYFCNSFLMLWESCVFTFTLAKQFKTVPDRRCQNNEIMCKIAINCLFGILVWVSCIRITLNPQYATCTSNFPKIQLWSPIGRLWQWTQVLLTIFMDAPLGLLVIWYSQQETSTTSHWFLYICQMLIKHS